MLYVKMDDCRVPEYLTRSQIIEYFINYSGSDISDNEDNDKSYELKHSILDNYCFLKIWFKLS